LRKRDAVKHQAILAPAHDAGPARIATQQRRTGGARADAAPLSSIVWYVAANIASICATPGHTHAHSNNGTSTLRGG